MNNRKKLPVGVENFEKLIKENFYYVDKTTIIATLLKSWTKVNIFTRPRRFGKSLNMNMLKTFFEIGSDKSVFEGLKISKEKELCDKYMGKFPVISISLKGIEGQNFQIAREAMQYVIGSEIRRFSFLAESEKLDVSERKIYDSMVRVDKGRFLAEEEMLPVSLLVLSELLAKHYGKEVIILIDEYDVPLDKAFQYGYYDEMVMLIRGLFGNALKSNSNLFFAVLTGCLRVSKESIFTGLNNFNIYSITNVEFDEYFGFTDTEVKEMLSYYGIEECYDTVKEWYDGYQFGETAVYCPWDVINYCKDRCADVNALPEDYWSNTSGNAMVRRFIDKADYRTKNEIEQLIAGETIVKEIRQDLTYNELDSSIENLWSVLFTTGYLTKRGRVDLRRYQLAIPNQEIRELFITQIREWFRDETSKDTPKLDALCDAFPEKDPQKIEELFGDYLWNTISIRDTAVAKERKENFYHGILLGLLAHKENWLSMSNAESGLGYSDIMIEIPKGRIGVVVEMKYAEDGDLERACMEALQQIEEKDYVARLKQDGMRQFIKYGIACYKKDCKVMIGNEA